jgi:hypothetical protein
VCDGADTKERNKRMHSGETHSRWKMVINHGVWGHFVHFCNGPSPIDMYKYVRKEIGKKRGVKSECVMELVRYELFLVRK